MVLCFIGFSGCQQGPSSQATNAQGQAFLGSCYIKDEGETPVCVEHIRNGDQTNISEAKRGCLEMNADSRMTVWMDGEGCPREKAVGRCFTDFPEEVPVADIYDVFYLEDAQNTVLEEYLAALKNACESVQSSVFQKTFYVIE